MKLKALVTQSCPTFCNPKDYSPPGSSVNGILLARILECSHSLLQGMLSTQGLNLGLLYCRWILYHLSHQRTYIAVCTLLKKN